MTKQNSHVVRVGVVEVTGMLQNFQFFKTWPSRFKTRTSRSGKNTTDVKTFSMGWPCWEWHTQFHWQLLITNSCFWLVNILLRKFETSSKKELMKSKTTTTTTTTNAEFSADLVTFTEEILNGKLHFLCSDKVAFFVRNLLHWHVMRKYKWSETVSGTHSAHKNVYVTLVSVLINLKIFRTLCIVFDSEIKHFLPAGYKRIEILKINALKVYFNHKKVSFPTIINSTWTILTLEKHHLSQPEKNT